MSVIGENIKRLRQEQNVTQKQLADDLCISIQAVSKWENAESSPDIMLLPQIAEHFDVSIDDLFKQNLLCYKNRAERLHSIYERTKSFADFVRAVNESEKVMENDRSARTLLQYAMLFYDFILRNIPKTIEIFEEAFQKRDDQTENYYRLIWNKWLFMCRVGKSQEAAAELDELLQKEPDNLDLINCKISYFYIMKDYENARKEYGRAIEKGFKDANLFCLGGDILKEFKEYDKAFALWEKALETDDTYIDAMFSIVFCHQELGHREEEKSTWKRSIDWLERHGMVEELAWPKEMLAKVETEN